MKRILLALTLVGLLFPLTPRAGADAEVSLNFFYDNLSPYGSWIEVADYGYCFQPAVAVSNSDWRPYADGYWAYTDFGWTWISYEDFGWATYHYGRWADLDSFGWVWVPGYEWGPAWVSWRTGGDYVGWAPLPPEGGEVVYQGRAITNQVDFQFGIGPLYYNFVNIRYIGEPVLRARIIPPTRNVTIINRTVNVTNITYNNSIVYNYGPDYSRLNQYSTRPVQRLKIQRETNVGADLAQGRKGNFNRVSGDQLTVMAPAIEKSQQRLAPRQVKAKVEKPSLETGWKGVNNRQQVEAEMKKGDPKNIPAPDFQPRKGRQEQTTEARPNESNRGQRQPAQERSEQTQNRPATQPADLNAERAEQRDARRAAEAQKAERDSSRQPNRAERNKPVNASRDLKTSDDSANAGNDRKDRQADTAGQRAPEPQNERASQDRQQAEQRQRRQAQRADQGAPEETQARRQQDRARQNRPDRAPQAEDASSMTATRENGDRRARAAQQASQPEQAQRQMQERRSQQQERARAQQQRQDQRQPAPQQRERQQQRQQAPQQQQQRNDSDQQQKGKKKKPNEDQPPQT